MNRYPLRSRCCSLAAVLPLVALLGCESAAKSQQRPATPRKPRLVVTIVIDQLAAWVLDRDFGRLDPDGAIRTTAARGAFHHRVVYGYASTFTAPGHAAIYTGAPPAESGIVGNKVWSRATKTRLSTVDDQKHPILGNEKINAGPSVLKAESVADVLRNGDSKSLVVSLSMKDRGAVLPAGQKPNLVLWYDATARGFTSSTYYGAALPSWFVEWRKSHGVERLFGVWEPLDAEMLGTAVGRDDAPGEENHLRFGTTFPHRLRDTGDPYATFTLAPQSTESLLEVARESVAQMRLGADDHTDLLAISVSSTDYVGHAFGPDSWEAVDNLIRVDRALGKLLKELEARFPIAVLITADHGVAPTVEQSRFRGHEAYRVEASALARRIDNAIDAALGKGTWVESVTESSVYLTDAARAPFARGKAVAAAIRELEKTPGVQQAFDTAVATTWKNDPDKLRRLVAASLHAQGSGDIYVVCKPFSMVMENLGTSGVGTTHGTPWRYDSDVPVLFAGPGVEHIETRDVFEQRRVAATIASLLGVAPPSAARVAPLPGAPTKAPFARGKAVASSGRP